MNNWKHVFLGLIAVILAAGFSLPVEAAAPKNNKPVAVAQVPIIIEADTLHFNDSTGMLFAEGSVTVTQGPNKVMANRIDGNTQKSEIWIDGQAHILQPGVDLIGRTTRYNYGQRTGTMQKVAGTVDKQIVVADMVEVLPNETIIHNGTVTRCPAKVPDYHVSATKVEIWPGDKMIIYNAKFWIKNTIIFSLPKYQKNLTQGSQSEFPNVGYNSRDGFSISQHFEYPLTDHISAFTKLVYYSQVGFKPFSGIINAEKDYSLSIVEGYLRDRNHNWIQKEPEVKLTLPSRKIGASPINYSFTALSGIWKDGTKRSWHQDYLLYFTHDPIQINSSTQLSVGTGVQTILESYDQSRHNGFRIDVTLSKALSPKLSSYIGYHHNTNSQTLFAFERADMSNELDIGINYKLDRLNSIGVFQSYDMANRRVFDRDFTWYRNLHCWEMAWTYRSKRHEFDVTLTTVKW